MSQAKTWLIATIVSFSLTAPANAVSGLPPARFDYVPRVKPIIMRLPANEIGTYCRPRAVGCATNVLAGPHKGRCLVYIAIGPSEDLILRHEYGHCNGWPADHPR